MKAPAKAAPAKPSPPFRPVTVPVTAQLRDDGGRQKTLKLGDRLVAYLGDDVEPTPEALGRIVDAWATQPYDRRTELGPRDCSRAVHGGTR